MSFSRHNLKFTQPVRDVRLCNGVETLISQRSVETRLQDSFRNGFDAGQKALGEQLVEQRKQLIELQNGVIRSLERALPQVIAESEKSIVLLALEAARHVVQQMPVDATLVERVVKRALNELKETTDYEVFLHPEDLTLLHAIQSGILPSAENKRVQFSPDPRVQRGDCLVKTRHGSVAAIRDLMFDKLENAVL